MTTTHIIKDRASGLFFQDLTPNTTSIALTTLKSNAMEFPDELAVHHAVKALRSLYGAFDFAPVDRN